MLTPLGPAEAEEVWRTSGGALEEAAGLAPLARIILARGIKSKQPLPLISLAKVTGMTEELLPCPRHMKVAGNHSWVRGGTPCIPGVPHGEAGVSCMS